MTASGRWQQVAAVFDQAVQQPPERRDTFLDEVCSDDPDLRREVEALLQEDSAGALIDRPVWRAAVTVLDDNAASMVGRQLGPYRLDALIGSGGMGEVYRATDTRLHRTVALKILTPALASDPQFRARFDREAQAIAALAHPSICAIHDVGHHDGMDFLVMEYLEGETFAARIERGSIPLPEVLRHAIAIADALDAAHRKGIVHRDLKPGNIMLASRDGASGSAEVKLVDFGLAKPASPIVSGTSVSAVPTTPATLTAQGTILGTFQYMAPEQLEGHEADARSDLFAFGSVIYEMATGTKAFTGKSHASLIGAIMHAQPPSMAASQPLTPPALDHIVRRCLAKDREDRWQTARDVLNELKHVASAGPELARSRDVWATRWLKIAGIALLGIAAVSGGFAWRSRPVTRATALVYTFKVAEPPGARFASVGGGGAAATRMAMSPDGRSLAFVAGAQQSLWVQSLDSAEPRLIPGAEGARDLFWSPDSQWIGYYTSSAGSSSSAASGELRKVRATGGSAQTICEAVAMPDLPRGGSWNAAGTILFSPGPRRGLFAVPDTGGTPTAVPSLPDQPSATGEWPEFLPDGRHFLFLLRDDTGANGGIFVGAIDGTARARIVDSDTRAQFVPPNRLLFTQQGVLMTQTFDPASLTLTGTPVPVAQPVAVSGSGYATVSASHTGVLVWSRHSVPLTHPAWVDRNGIELSKAFGEAGGYSQLQATPDGSAILASRELGSGRPEVSVVDTKRATRNVIRWASHAIFSPDGARVVVADGANTPLGLAVLSAAGGDTRNSIVTDRVGWPTDWTRDGRFVVFFEASTPKSGVDTRVVDLTSRTVRTLLQNAGDQSQAQVSPDQRWLAYMSNEDGRFDVYVQPFDRPGERITVSSGGGYQPRWRQDGRELFFLTEEGNLMSVAVEDRGGRLVAQRPVALFTLRISPPSISPMFAGDYAVVDNGRRFLINEALSTTDTRSLTVVVNWMEQLAR